MRLWVTKYKQELHFSRLRAGKSASPPLITKVGKQEKRPTSADRYGVRQSGSIIGI